VGGVVRVSALRESNLEVRNLLVRLAMVVAPLDHQPRGDWGIPDVSERDEQSEDDPC
jgi:hypothetical protein